MTWFAETEFGRPVSKKRLGRNSEGSKEGSVSGNEEAERR